MLVAEIPSKGRININMVCWEMISELSDLNRRHFSTFDELAIYPRRVYIRKKEFVVPKLPLKQNQQKKKLQYLEE